MSICESGMNLADFSAVLLAFLVLLFLLFAFVLSLILPPRRREGVSKKQANYLIARSVLSIDGALGSFDEGGQVLLRIKKYFAIGILFLLFLILVTEQVCVGA